MSHRREDARGQVARGRRAGLAGGGADRGESAEVVRLDAVRRRGCDPRAPGRGSGFYDTPRPAEWDLPPACAHIRRWGPMLDFAGLIALAGLLLALARWLYVGGGA